jgi:hypothetical protein
MEPLHGQESLHMQDQRQGVRERRDRLSPDDEHQEPDAPDRRIVNFGPSFWGFRITYQGDSRLNIPSSVRFMPWGRAWPSLNRTKKLPSWDVSQKTPRNRKYRQINRSLNFASGLHLWPYEIGVSTRKSPCRPLDSLLAKFTGFLSVVL